MNNAYDLVYVVREGEHNPDLLYSLRSVSKYCNFRNIWIAGHCPSWVTNVKVIPVPQGDSKYRNSTANLLAACKTPEITDDFILMNDDFFALRPIEDWEESLNKTQSTLIEHWIYLTKTQPTSPYRREFRNTYNFLREQGKPVANWELHIPFILNKRNFLMLCSMSEIIEYRQRHDIFMKRSIYKNYFPPENKPTYMKDVKLFLNEDVSERFDNSDWLSVRDCMTDSDRETQYPKLHQLLTSKFNEPCPYEK